MRTGNLRYQSGFGYLLVLFAVSALGLLAAGAGQVWRSTAQREREAELLFVGHQYRKAIESYQSVNFNGQHQWPARLEDLLEDRRLPTVRRHLRRLYRDPMTENGAWVLVKSGEHIIGVHTAVHTATFRKHFEGEDAAFNGTSSCDDWVFIARQQEAAK